MKKTLIICAMAACLAGCAEFERDRYYVAGYAPTCGQQVTYTSCCQQVMPCETCMPCMARPAPQPKQVIVVMPAPQPQPVVEHEIVYQPQQPSCACAKCGCRKAK